MKPLAANVVVYNREQVFASRLNQFLHIGLQLPERDYYQGLTFESLVGLKSVLSDINNIFTLKVGLGFAHWLGNRLGLSETERECIVNSIVQNPPNANGYDVEIPDPINVIAEIKCNIPINKGAVFGSAQRNGIEKDVRSLIQGKSKSRMEPSKCLKFLVFLDTPNIREATNHYLKNCKSFKERIEIVRPDIPLTDFNKIYIVHVGLIA